MHEEPNPACGPTPIDLDDTERAVMMILLLSDPPAPWAVSEIALQLGSEMHALDAVESLHAAGLVHRFGEFVFPTRPAVRAHQLQDTA